MAVSFNDPQSANGSSILPACHILVPEKATSSLLDFSQAFGAMQLKLPVAVKRIFLPYHSQLLVQVKPYQSGIY